MDRNERERNDSFPHGYEPLIGRQAEAAAADDESFGGKKTKKDLRGGGAVGGALGPAGMNDGAERG